MNKPTIDNVTIKNLRAALAMHDIRVDDEETDIIIDIVELLEIKGGNATIDDILNVKERNWANDEKETIRT